MRRRFVSTCFLFLVGSLALLRAQLVLEVGVPLGRALDLGLACGVLLDLAMAIGVVGATIVIGAWHRRIAHHAALAMSIVLVGFTAANVAYFGYFDARLEPWVVTSHLGDLPTIHGSVQSVLGAPALLACAVGVPLLVLTCRSLRRPSTAQQISAWFGCGLVAASLAIAFGATVAKQRIVNGSSIVAEQVFVAWVEGAAGLLPDQEIARAGLEQTLREAAALDPATPGLVLATFRDWNPQSDPVPGSDDLPGAQPLVRERHPDPAHTRALRDRLGLPVEGPIHIVVLFLESVRAFEMEHPALGPQVFPRMHARFAREALRFPIAYASAPEAGKTVQGQLATLCSLLPNFGGVAAYIGHPYLRVKSLAEAARDHGYRTLWISGGKESFHNKRVFESLHGTDRFFGFEYLRHIPYEGTQVKCGYPDRPMLHEALRLLQREARDGRPVFANILTVSTHHPVYEIPEGPVPRELRAAAKQRPASTGYPGYLSGLRYIDESLDAFFSALWDSPLGDRTLVVVLGDHGQRYKPHLPVAQHQIVELMARVPFAILTKNLAAPAVIRQPIHQIDVAPTVADIAGFTGRVAWVGRNVLDGPGSPWVFAEKERLHYRVADRACYTLQGDDVPTCYRLDSLSDPMLSFDLPRIPADPAEVRFFQSIAVAARQAITLNLVMPAAGR